MQLYTISDTYIDFLRQKIPKVYSNKLNHRNHTRKYLGPIILNEIYPYYIPLSSPKKSDYQYAGNKMVVKKSIVPIIRMYERGPDGEKVLKGTLRISDMIPVPSSELEKYDIENETSLEYKHLIFSELRYIRKNLNIIMKKAHIMYQQKISNNPSASYISSALDFRSLEMLYMQFILEDSSII